MRAAVVGHVEWIEFGRVDHVPAPGEIVHVSESWQEPGGGGAVAAVQLAKLAGGGTLYTALGDDEIGHRAKRELEELGLRRGGGLPARAAAARLRPRRRRRRAHDHGDRQPARAARRRPAALGASSTRPTPSTSRPATRAPCARPRGRHARVHRPRAGDAARAGRGARRAGRERARPGRALRARRARARRRATWCAPPGATAASTSAPTGERGRWDGDAAARADQRPLRLRRQLRRGADLRARRRACRSREALELGARCGAACATGAAPTPGSCGRPER